MKKLEEGNWDFGAFFERETGIYSKTQKIDYRILVILGIFVNLRKRPEFLDNYENLDEYIKNMFTKEQVRPKEELKIVPIEKSKSEEVSNCKFS